MKRDKRTGDKKKLLLTKQRVRELTPVQPENLEQVAGGLSWPSSGVNSDSDSNEF